MGSGFMLEKGKEHIGKFRDNFVKAVPVIVFYLVVFYGVIFLFGTSYLLLVSVATTTFKLNYQKQFCFKAVLSLGVEQLVLCVLAFAAQQSMLLCVLLNGLVPFLLVFLRTTRFNQRGYFINGMVFVFLQLRPVDKEGLLPQLLVYLCILCVLAAAMKLWAFLHRKEKDYPAVREGLGAIASRFQELSEGKQVRGISAEMAAIQNRFYAGGQAARRVSENRTVSVPYIFALLFQRTAYFVVDYHQQKNPFSRADRVLFAKLSEYLEQVRDQLNEEDNEPLIQRAGEILNEIHEVSETASLFTRNFMHLLVFALKIITEKEREQDDSHIDWRHFFQEKKERLHPNQFEMRFALRLSIVLIISFSISRCLNITHSYWLPLNAFLLVQPMYEESTRRLKNRILGTAAGSVAIFFILMYLKSITAHFILSAVLISFMYSFTPGSIQQVSFSTGFALTLASLSLNSTTAVELRLVYVLAAVVLVLFANRFCFPTSLYEQFRFNLREVVHMETDYLDFLRIGCRRRIDYSVMEDALAQFGLTYGQAMEYLTKNRAEEVERYMGFLNVLWRMVAEVEQMVFYVTTESITAGERDGIISFAIQMQGALKKISEGQTELNMENAAESGLEPKNDFFLGHLMEKYIGNMRKLNNICRKDPALQAYFVEKGES